MAGSIVAMPSEGQENPVTAIGEHWKVEYARFFSYPSLPSTCPSLIPLPDSRRKRSNGTWISSSSTSAFLNLASDRSNSEFILTVTLLGKIHEEHRIPKLHFSWPQVSCVPGFPSRGSKVILVSYRDEFDQIQKFALRFPTLCEAQAFIYALKEIMEATGESGLPSSNSVSETSSLPNFLPPDALAYRPKQDWNSMATTDSCNHQMQSSLRYDFTKNSISPDTALNQDMECIFRALPPSFTSLVRNCLPVPEQAAKPTISAEDDFKLQIMRCLEDSSFLDMLGKVEQIISELGGNVMP